MDKSGHVADLNEDGNPGSAPPEQSTGDPAPQRPAIDSEQQSIIPALEAAVAESGNEYYLLKLYVTGSTPQSIQAVANIKAVCEQYLEGRYELEVIDIYQQPELAESAEIVAAPTLVKSLPLPLRRLIGDLSDVERVLVGLGLQSA